MPTTPPPPPPPPPPKTMPTTPPPPPPKTMPVDDCGNPAKYTRQHKQVVPIYGVYACCCYDKSCGVKLCDDTKCKRLTKTGTRPSEFAYFEDNFPGFKSLRNLRGPLGVGIRVRAASAYEMNRNFECVK
jgi:hypothetical protein